MGTVDDYLAELDPGDRRPSVERIYTVAQEVFPRRSRASATGCRRSCIAESRWSR